MTSAHSIFRVFLVALLAVVVFTTTLSCGGGYDIEMSADGTIPLRYTYNEGDTWVQEYNQVEQTTSDEGLLLEGESPDSTHIYTERRTVEVLSVRDDGTAMVKTSCERVRDTIDGQIQLLEDPLRGSHAIDTTGRVLEVKGSQLLAEDFAATGDIDPIVEFLDLNYDLSAIHYPESGGAKVGDEWSDDYVIELPGMEEEAKVETTFKLTEVSIEDNRQVATISHTFELLPLTLVMDWSKEIEGMIDPSGEPLDPGDAIFKASMSLTMSFSGETKVDVSTGQPISCKGDYTIAGSSQIDTAPLFLVPMDERGPFHMEGTGTYEFHEVTTDDSDLASQEIPLRYAFEMGDTWVVEENRREEGTVDAALFGETGDPIPTLDTTKDKRTFEVVKVTADGEATLSAVYETLDRTMDGEPQDFSDCSPQEFEMKMDSTGLVTYFYADPEGIVESDLPGYHQEDQYYAVFDLSCDITALLYPKEQKGRVGDEWTISYTMEASGLEDVEATLSAELKHVYEDAGRLLAVIHYSVTTPTTSSTTDISASVLEEIGDNWDTYTMGELVVLMTYTSDLSYRGTALVDTSTGRVISSQGEVYMWSDYEYSKAPISVIPLDQRGPFGYGGIGTVTLVEME